MRNLLNLLLLIGLFVGACFSSNTHQGTSERFLVEESDEEINNISIGNSESHGSDGERIPSSDPAFWFYMLAALSLCCGAGLMSGLTVGYLSIDQLELEIKMRNGTEEEKRHASIIMPILSKHHLLLSTLLVANAFFMETLPICLDKIVPSYMAVIISTAGVVTFGEIIPQAVCTGPQQIQIASKLGPTVKLLILFLYPICYPVSKILDHFLGTHGKTRFVKKDLKTLIELHQIDRNESPEHEHGDHQADRYTQLTAEETKVINSTIDLRDTPVTKEMETIDKVFMLSNQAKIDNDMIKRIARSGFSKIPIYRGYNKNEVVGILKAKTLIDYQDRYLNKTITETGIPLTPALIVASDTSMLEMLMLFQEKRTAIALISEQKVKDKVVDSTLFSRKNLMLDKESQKLVGLVSLKDIFEEILESKMTDDDVHGPVTLFSGPGQKRKLRSQNNQINLEDTEAFEKPEKGLSQPFLKK